MPAAGTCSRCGRFYCLTCVPDALQRGKVDCPECAGSREEREAPETIAHIVKEMWIAQLIVAFVIAVLIAAFGAVQDKPAFLVAGIAAFFAAPFLLCAALIAATRSMWSVWSGFVLDVVVFAALAILSFGVNCSFVIAIAVPIYTLSRVRKLGRLIQSYPEAYKRAV